MSFHGEIEDALAVVRWMTPRQQMRVARAMRWEITAIEEEETMTEGERDKLRELKRAAHEERMQAWRKRWNLDE